MTCKNYTRSFLWSQFTRDVSSLYLLSLHNVYFLIDILRKFRQAVLDDNVEEYLTTFIKNYHSNDKEGVPKWVIDACEAGGIDVAKLK